MLTTAFINTLGVATWYLLGIAYVSTASRYWPHTEEIRGKWLPMDVMAEVEGKHPFDKIPSNMLGPVLIVAWLMFLTIWPVAIYNHAKRGFRTKPGGHAK